LLAEPTIASVMRAAQSSLSFVGIGAVGIGSSAAIVETLRLTRAEWAQFEKAKPVGDVCARFSNDLRKIPTVVRLAVDEEKVRGVLGALHGRLLNVLMCDDALATALLASAERH
jgi:DNA-binding transcriptional regulator LsrR (DeoR family)